jgi:DNA-binding MarR family transcriptional regulator
MVASPPGPLFTKLVLTVFRLNGALVATGDELVGDLGLSTTRWQVLGMVVDGPLTVSGIARRMGLTRQSVQRTANCLVQDGFAEAVANPDHQTAKLYRLTPLGKRVMAEVGLRQKAWAARLATGLGAQRLEDAESILQRLCTRLERALTTPEVLP